VVLLRLPICLAVPHSYALGCQNYIIIWLSHYTTLFSAQKKRSIWDPQIEVAYVPGQFKLPSLSCRFTVNFALYTISKRISSLKSPSISPVFLISNVPSKLHCTHFFTLTSSLTPISYVCPSSNPLTWRHLVTGVCWGWTSFICAGVIPGVGTIGGVVSVGLKVASKV
jgi:hypothetical protein